MTDIATEKAGKLLDARDRHQRQLEEKMRIQEARLVEEEEKRMNHYAKRQLSIDKIRRNAENMNAMNLVSISLLSFSCQLPLQIRCCFSLLDPSSLFSFDC